MPLNAPPPQDRFNQALALHQKGALAEARAIYEDILKAQPNHFDALHLLGVVAAQTKNHQLAADLIGRAIALHPNNAAFHSNRGNALQALGQLEAAVASYDRAIALKPDYAEAHYNHGITLKALGRLEAAVASFDKAIGLKPSYAQAYNDRGIALQTLKRPEAALQSYDKAISLKPDYAEAYNNRGIVLKDLQRLDAAVASYDHAIHLRPDYAEAHSNRGNALQSLKQLDAAVASYDRAIRLRPDYAEAFFNRGSALRDLKQLEAAVASYDKAISLAPGYAEAYGNRGTALKELGHLDAAVASYDKAISLKPDYAEAYYNRGNALMDGRRLEAARASYTQAIAIRPGYFEALNNRGNALKFLLRPEDAVADFDKAVGLNPEFADAYVGKAMILLSRGELVRGWELYEWRWKLAELKPQKRNHPQPLWHGMEPLKGKTILLYAEQGMGDAIQFCRYVTPVAALGARVILEMPKRLVALARGIEGVSEAIAEESLLPPFDFHCPLLSLPLAFKTTLATIPSPQAYLRADPAKVTHWADWLGPKTKPRVGLMWTGSKRAKNDARSIALLALLPYLPPGLDYVSLQKDISDEDKAVVQANPHIRHYGDEQNDFGDAAALCELMDVVVTVDTSMVHLSGALGKKTWLLLSHPPEWRWLMDRDDSPWYASVKLYKQDAGGQWEPVFEKIRADLLELG